ncbi:MAG TPA: hypothetical protein VF731_11290 [Solirubrobacterales bacterium]
MKPALALALALLAALLLAPAAAAKFPAVRATMTIAGTTSGVEVEDTTVRPQAEGCPAQKTEVEERATVDWRATFSPVVVPLAKGPYLFYSPPRYRGGVTGGSYSFHDTYLRAAPERFEPFAPEEPAVCPKLESFSAAAKLSQRPHTSLVWDDESFPPAVSFGVGVLGGKGYGTIAAAPESLAAPELEWDGENSDLVPIDVANDLPLYEMPESPAGAEPYTTGVVLNWKRIQSKLGPLRHHGTVRLHLVRHLDNSRRPSPFDEQCFRGGAHPSCSESMQIDFTVTLRWLSPARGCDLAAKKCLLGEFGRSGPPAPPRGAGPAPRRPLGGWSSCSSGNRAPVESRSSPGLPHGGAERCYPARRRA